MSDTIGTAPTQAIARNAYKIIIINNHSIHEHRTVMLRRKVTPLFTWGALSALITIKHCK